jgi:hypothetical protein
MLPDELVQILCAGFLILLMSKSKPIPRNDMAQLKAKLCELAEQIARDDFGTPLDYSVKSIQKVERILRAIHDEYCRTDSDDGLYGIALEFGAYLVAVIERHFGPAVWERDHPEFGKDAFPLRWRDSTLFPVEWCMKRMIDGPGDNVWSKFQVLVVKDASDDA